MSYVPSSSEKTVETVPLILRLLITGLKPGVNEKILRLLSKGGVNQSPKKRPVLILWVLLCLFIVRVLGQLLVAVGWGWFLPPMNAWYSGLLPYRYLLPAQILIIALYGSISVSFTRGKGLLVAPAHRLGRVLQVFGAVYFVGMLIRYAVTMFRYPERRWTGGSIPVFFHLVLSAFILALARYHLANSSKTDSRGKLSAKSKAGCPQTIITSSIAGASRAI